MHNINSSIRNTNNKLSKKRLGIILFAGTLLTTGVALIALMPIIFGTPTILCGIIAVIISVILILAGIYILSKFRNEFDVYQKKQLKIAKWSATALSVNIGIPCLFMSLLFYIISINASTIFFILFILLIILGFTLDIVRKKKEIPLDIWNTNIYFYGTLIYMWGTFNILVILLIGPLFIRSLSGWYWYGRAFCTIFIFVMLIVFLFALKKAYLRIKEMKNKKAKEMLLPINIII